MSRQPTLTEMFNQPDVVTKFLYTFGSNEKGALGYGDRIRIGSFAPLPRRVSLLRYQNVTAVSCGNLHTGVITEDGKLYTFGKNELGQLGIRKDMYVSYCHTPTFIESLQKEKIIDVSCAVGHTAVVTASGKLYTWGTDWETYSFCGCIKNYKPQKFMEFKDKNIVAVSCGFMHTVAVTDEGEVFTFGRNHKGQLGLGDDRDTARPTVIKSIKNERIVSVSCGDYHTALVTDSGQLYTFGLGTSGQLGFGGTDSFMAPCLVSPKDSKGRRKFKHIISVDCGECHTAVVTRSGKLYTFGSNIDGQLGLGHNNKILLPRFVKGLKGVKIKQVACGSWHTAVVTEDGQLYTFGRNNDGQLGLGHKRNINVPTLVHMDKKVISVSAGGGHTAIIVE